MIVLHKTFSEEAWNIRYHQQTLYCIVKDLRVPGKNHLKTHKSVLQKMKTRNTPCFQNLDFKTVHHTFWQELEYFLVLFSQLHLHGKTPATSAIWKWSYGSLISCNFNLTSTPRRIWKYCFPSCSLCCFTFRFPSFFRTGRKTPVAPATWKLCFTPLLPSYF